MKTTVQNLYNLTEGLNSLLDKELETSTALVVQRNFTKISEEAKTSEAVRRRIVEKYKDYINDNDQFTDDGKREEFKEEIGELMSQEVDVDIKKLKVSDLGETIKPRTLAQLSLIIDKEGDE